MSNSNGKEIIVCTLEIGNRNPESWLSFNEDLDDENPPLVDFFGTRRCTTFKD
jgi:hypothetical protein